MIYFNKEKLEDKKFLYSSIIFYKNLYIYQYAINEKLLNAPASAPWDCRSRCHYINPPLEDRWQNIKNEWKSDEEVDYRYYPELRNLFVNNLIIFSRKLKLEKLLKS